MKTVFYSLVVFSLLFISSAAVAGINPKPIKPAGLEADDVVEQPMAETDQRFQDSVDFDFASENSSENAVSNENAEGSDQTPVHTGVLFMILCIGAFFGFPYLLEALNDQ